jgi:hypothetical protein
VDADACSVKGNYSALDKFLMSLIASIFKTDFLDIKTNFMFLGDFEVKNIRCPKVCFITY